MPYITMDQRLEIDNEIQSMGLSWFPQNAGELNYLVSRFIANYLEENGLKYANCNEMIGALECAKLELYRVMIGPYEDEKIAENGGVYRNNNVGKDY
jgi:hypothetical protein